MGNKLVDQEDVCLPDTFSQRKRTSRRVTNPVRPRTSPTPDSTSGEQSVVSTADDQDAPPRRTTRRRQQPDTSNTSDTQSDSDRVRALSATSSARMFDTRSRS